MNASQAVAAVILVMQAVVAFALLPQPDFAIPAPVKFVLGGLAVGLNVAALYLKVSLPGRETTS